MRSVGLAMLLAALPLCAASQLVGPGVKKAAAEKPAVEYLFPEQVRLPAGKPAVVDLHFRVGEGLHVNSHTPRQPELIPTTLTIPEGSGVRLLDAAYPKGAAFVFAAEPAYKLSVYTGEFVVKARVLVQPGKHLVEAKLRYQACDNNACLPPRTVVAAIEMAGE